MKDATADAPAVDGSVPAGADHVLARAMAEMYAAGSTYEKVGAAFGVSAMTARRIVKAQGGVSRKPGEALEPHQRVLKDVLTLTERRERMLVLFLVQRLTVEEIPGVLKGIKRVTALGDLHEALCEAGLDGDLRSIGVRNRARKREDDAAWMPDAVSLKEAQRQLPRVIELSTSGKLRHRRVGRKWLINAEDVARLAQEHQVVHDEWLTFTEAEELTGLSRRQLHNLQAWDSIAVKRGRKRRREAYLVRREQLLQVVEQLRADPDLRRCKGCGKPVEPGLEFHHECSGPVNARSFWASLDEQKADAVRSELKERMRDWWSSEQGDALRERLRPTSPAEFTQVTCFLCGRSAERKPWLRHVCDACLVPFRRAMVRLAWSTGEADPSKPFLEANVGVFERALRIGLELQKHVYATMPMRRGPKPPVAMVYAIEVMRSLRFTDPQIKDLIEKVLKRERERAGSDKEIGLRIAGVDGTKVGNDYVKTLRKRYSIPGRRTRARAA